MTDVVTEQTPPLLQGPSDKEKKYDRQLRLWAASGQQALEDAHILLINSGSGTVGVETLKNLVLPGIGHFTIADDAVVTEADLGVNFFLDEESLGKPRAESCVKLLQELNQDVHGDWFPKQEGDTLQTLFEREQKYTLLVYSLPIDPERLDLVQQYGQRQKVPLLSVHSAGFYSYFQIHLPGSFPIVDTHPDSTATTDLRLLTPWPELTAFAEDLTKDIDNLDAHDHGHIPYVVLLLHYLKEWTLKEGTTPISYAEKKLFREFVSNSARTDNPEGGEENYDEAAAAILKTVAFPQLPSPVKAVFEYKPSDAESNSSFWVIADAIRQFFTKHKELPLPGSVPDMKAKSSVYVQLQNLYKTKARKDVAEVLDIVRGHAQGSEIDVAEVEAFCKNAAFINLIHGPESSPRSLQEVADKQFEDDGVADLTMVPQSLFSIYLSLKATSHVTSADSTEILATISKSIRAPSLNKHLVQVTKEVARAHGGELHNISALTGGMVAQEVIKIITKQYIPIDNTCIFDGITSRIQVLRI